VFEDGDALNLDQLIGAGGAPPTSGAPGTGPGEVPSSASLTKEDWFNPAFRFPESGFSLEQAILRLIERALAETRGNVSRAARKLGVSRDYLRYRLGGWKDSAKSGDPSMPGELGAHPQPSME
jgi:hypothetical protein